MKISSDSYQVITSRSCVVVAPKDTENVWLASSSL